MANYSDPWVYTSEDMIREYDKLSSPKDLDPLIDRIGDSRFVLLGEATHGTHEFYTWRAAITRRLIEEKGFNFIAVEGDWPECFRINQYVKGHPEALSKASEVFLEFNRWPTWMWANWEMVALVEWLKTHNQSVENSKKVGFYGLDVYSLWQSIEIIMDYLKREDPKTARLAHHVLNCFEPYEKGQEYAEAVYHVSASCKDKAVKLLAEIRKNSPYYDNDPEGALNAEMNALVTANAEEYYRSMVSFDDKSWNIRDSHMVAVLESLMKFYGKTAKTIIWEHNTHVGDARATNMGQSGLLNVGQLIREQHEQDGVVIVGFSTYEGSVIAGRFWGAEMEELEVPPAKNGSIEEILHRDSPEDKLLVFDRHPALKERFSTWYGHRAIGVVFRPEYERRNYVPTILSSRYDALIYLDRTQGLYPIHLKPNGHLAPETYPFGF